MFEYKFKITNLDCPACVTLSQEALKDIPGVIDARVDLSNGEVELTAKEEVKKEAIIGALSAIDKNVQF